MRHLRLSGSILPQTELFYFVAFYGLVKNSNQTRFINGDVSTLYGLQHTRINLLELTYDMRITYKIT